MPLLKFRSYTAASRKRNMAQFGMCRAEATSDLAVIEDAADTPLGITGTQDGVNRNFTVSAPIASLYRNGLRMNPGNESVLGDYFVVGNTLTWVIAPLSDDIILGFAV